jgi:hypothetical protein
MDVSAVGSSALASYATGQGAGASEPLQDGGTNVAVIKGAIEIQKTLMTQLLQSLGIGQNVDIEV